MDKIISFIIPSYNVEQYLKTCLNSFIAPDVMQQIEVIIIDDGSRDHTAEIAATYVTKYPYTFRLISKENGGHGSAINVGSKAAVGTFIKVIDADDWVVTENLPKLIEKLSNCNADVVLTKYHMVDMTTRKKESYCMYLSDYHNIYTLKDVMSNWELFSNVMTFHGIMYRRKFYEKYRHELPEKIFYEDQEYASIPCCHAAKIQAFSLFLYQYMVGNEEQSVSAQNQLKRIDHLKQIILDLINYYVEHNELSNDGKAYLAQKIENILLSYYTVACIINPDKSDGRKRCCQIHSEINKKRPELVRQIKKKYLIYQIFSYIRLSPESYRKLLHSKIYLRLTKKHALKSNQK